MQAGYAKAAARFEEEDQRLKLFVPDHALNLRDGIARRKPQYSSRGPLQAFSTQSTRPQGSEC
jgi:hypothetical protein